MNLKFLKTLNKKDLINFLQSGGNRLNREDLLLILLHVLKEGVVETRTVEKEKAHNIKYPPELIDLIKKRMLQGISLPAICKQEGLNYHTIKERIYGHKRNRKKIRQPEPPSNTCDLLNTPDGPLWPPLTDKEVVMYKINDTVLSYFNHTGDNPMVQPLQDKFDLSRRIVMRLLVNRPYLKNV